MFDHVSNTIKYIVIVVLSFPHEGRGADHFVLLVHIGLVKERVKVKAQVISVVIFTIIFLWCTKCQRMVKKMQKPATKSTNIFADLVY